MEIDTQKRGVFFAKREREEKYARLGSWEKNFYTISKSLTADQFLKKYVSIRGLLMPFPAPLLIRIVTASAIYGVNKIWKVCFHDFACWEFLMYFSSPFFQYTLLLRINCALYKFKKGCCLRALSHNYRRHEIYLLKTLRSFYFEVTSSLLPEYYG